MYLFYVDESGDVGIVNSPTRYFALSGLVVHELRWEQLLEATIRFRRDVRLRYGLKLREEIHAAHFMNKPGDARRIAKSLRLRILRDVVDFQSQLPDISVVNVIVDKAGKPPDFDVFGLAWKYLVQRFHDTMSHRNFPGPQNAQDYGMLIVDRTDEVRLRQMLRRLRRYNPVPNRGGSGYRQVLLTSFVEDPVHRDSLHSYFIQLADVNAYFLYQKFAPSKYLRNKGGANYFDRLDPVLCKVASSTDAQGIVRL